MIVRERAYYYSNHYLRYSKRERFYIKDNVVYTDDHKKTRLTPRNLLALVKADKFRFHSCRNGFSLTRAYFDD